MTDFTTLEVLCQECNERPRGKGRTKYCDECAPKVDARNRKSATYRHHESLGGHQAFHLKQRYGISLEQFEEMVKQQRSRCAICKRKVAKLHVDHDHMTNRVRKLLCFGCNTGLGKLGDDPQRIRAAADYVEEHRV